MRRFISYYGYLLTPLCCILACSEYVGGQLNTEQIISTPVERVFNAEVVNHVTTTPDSLSLRGIDQIRLNPYNGCLYVINTRRREILIYDQDLNYIDKFGKYGQGQEDFRELRDIAFFRNGDIAVMDQFESSIKLFDRNFKLKKIYDSKGFPVLAKLAVTADQCLLINAVRRNRDSLFTVLSTDSTVTGQFGAIYPYRLPQYSDAYNSVNYVGDDNYIYCAFYHHPVIRKYNALDFSFESEIDYSHFQEAIYMKNIFEQQEKNMPAEGKFRSPIYMSGFSIDENFIYLFPYGKNMTQIYLFEKNNGNLYGKYVCEEFRAIECRTEDYFFGISRSTGIYKIRKEEFHE